MISLPDRFWSQVEKTDTCWLWTGRKGADGYGRSELHPLSTLAHRLSWAANIGPLDPGLEIDHLCRVRNCVNPAHLEQVTRHENQRRSPLTKMGKSHCPQGHPYSGENLYVRPSDGARCCRTCNTKTHRNLYRERATA